MTTGPIVARLVDHTAAAAFAVNERRIITAVNDAACRVLGLRRSTAVGRPCYEVVAALDSEGRSPCRQPCPVFDGFCAGRPVRLDWANWRRPDGSLLPVVASATSVPPTMRGDGTVAIVSVMELDTPPLARPPAAARPPADLRERLTPRELEILMLLAEGRSSMDVARTLVLSPNTVRTHVQNMLAKLGVRSRVAAVALALQGGASATPPAEQHVTTE